MMEKIRTMIRTINRQHGYGLVEYSFALGILAVVALTAMGAADHIGRSSIEAER